MNPFATSVSNSTRSAGLHLDFRFAKLISNHPTYFLLDGLATPFAVSTASIRSAYAALDPPALALLDLLPRSISIQRRIREILTQARIGLGGGGLDPAECQSRLRKTLTPLLAHLASTSIIPIDQPQLTTLNIPRSAALVVDFLLSEVDWTITAWSRWIREMGLRGRGIDTIEDLMVAAGGNRRVVWDDAWKRSTKVEKKVNKVEKRVQKKREKDAGKDGEKEFLVDLKVMAASYRDLERQPFVSLHSLISQPIRY